MHPEFTPDQLALMTRLAKEKAGIPPERFLAAMESGAFDQVLAKLKGKNPLQLARLVAGQDAIDSWLASPEGQAALNTLREESL